MNFTPRTMIVEDDPQETSLLSEVLKTWNCDCRVARNGGEALEVAASFTPELVVMSVTIPDQDGWLVCCKLKLGKQPPKVMLTTEEITERNEHFADFVRADKLLRKPFTESDLDSVLQEIGHDSSR